MSEPITQKRVKTTEPSTCKCCGHITPAPFVESYTDNDGGAVNKIICDNCGDRKSIRLYALGSAGGVIDGDGCNDWMEDRQNKEKESAEQVNDNATDPMGVAKIMIVGMVIYAAFKLMSQGG